MRRQRPLDFKLWLRKSPPSCAQSTIWKQHSLPVNVCLLRSSIMIRAAPWEVLGTSAAAGRSARGRSSGCVRTPKPPQRKLQRWRLAHHSTLASRPWQRSRSFASRSPRMADWWCSRAQDRCGIATRSSPLRPVTSCPRSTALGTMLARAVCCHMGLTK
jgi:hypothetical protein